MIVKDKIPYNRLQNTVLLFLLLVSTILSSQTKRYVSQEKGSDSNNGSSASSPFKTIKTAVDFLKPGDTLYIMGKYTNASFNPDYTYSGNINDPYIWSQENTIKISNLHGKAGKYITIKAYDQNTVLKGDGANIFRVTNCSYLRIEDLELYGQVEKISLETAKALQFLYRNSGSSNSLYRVPPGTSDEEVKNMTFSALKNIKRPSYTDTRGFYFSNVHHIDFINNKIHHVPGNGFRVADCEYINIIGNEIHDTSRKSYSGTHGLVVTKTKSTDNQKNYKVSILRNKVHHNYNEIYSWAPSKTFINPRIDEGKGISLQRNNVSSWVDGKGRILVENNVCYWNGYSGIHSNDGYRIDFINNTCYMNSYTNTVTYAGKEQRGNNIGISSQRGNGIRIINNISVIDTDWNGFALSASNSTGLVVRNNLIYGVGSHAVSIAGDIDAVDVNTKKAEPRFVDQDNFNFDLKETSPAISHADKNYAPAEDYYQNPRDDQPDAGAIEYSASLGVEDLLMEAGNIYPNPFTDRIFIKKINSEDKINIYNLLGQQFNALISIRHSNDGTEIDTSKLPRGTYLIRIGTVTKIILKTK
ncbi:MAG: hypothetical protein DSY82_03830 [Flavobacteriia bacterium]|nr:MAG: hypothetical protein DSY82_03830 [Flavobacteriia bacterium]